MIATLVVYVDDITIAAATMEWINNFKRDLAATYAIKDLGPMKWIVGLNVDYDMKAKQHARLLVRRLMDDLCHLSQSRLLSIIANRRKEVANLDPNRTSPPFSQHPRVHKLASGPIK